MHCAVYSRGMRFVALNPFAALALPAPGYDRRGGRRGATRGLWEVRRASYQLVQGRNRDFDRFLSRRFRNRIAGGLFTDQCRVICWILTYTTLPQFVLYLLRLKKGGARVND